MSQSLETELAAPPTEATARLGGPIIAAVKGADPDSVMRAAEFVASKSSGGVTAVSVLTPLPVIMSGESAFVIPPDMEEERYAACADGLKEKLDAFGAAARPWKRTVVHGSPAIALTDLARAQGAELLVVGIGRHKVLDRIFGADTALRTVQRASCPVLVVHPSFDAPFHEVVVATDFSPASVAAARAAVPLLAPDATLHIVHAWQPRDSLEPLRAAAEGSPPKFLPESMRRFVSLLAIPTGVAVRTAIREGRPAELVLEYAKTHRADLITAGRHGRNLLQRLLVGSQTTSLLRATEHSLLIAPDPPFEERDRLRLELTGVSECKDSVNWEAQLRGLIQRNLGRATVVEVDDRMFGAQVVESGYVLLGAAYYPTTKRVELTLGDSAHGARRVTRTMGGIDCVAVEADASGRDQGVRITHGSGQTVLTFLGD